MTNIITQPGSVVSTDFAALVEQELKNSMSLSVDERRVLEANLDSWRDCLIEIKMRTQRQASASRAKITNALTKYILNKTNNPEIDSKSYQSVQSVINEEALWKRGNTYFLSIIEQRIVYVNSLLD